MKSVDKSTSRQCLLLRATASFKQDSPSRPACVQPLLNGHQRLAEDRKYLVEAADRAVRRFGQTGYALRP